MSRIPKSAPALPDLETWQSLWSEHTHNYARRMKGLRDCARDAANGNRRAQAIMQAVWDEHARTKVLARLKS